MPSDKANLPTIQDQLNADRKFMAMSLEAGNTMYSNLSMINVYGHVVHYG